MSKNRYDVYSKFDLKKHAETFTSYLEVIITEDGRVEYAVPSHQERLIALACVKHGVTREELNSMCPREFYFDFMRWLCMMTGAMAVWNNFYEADKISEAQVKILTEMESAGVYKGPVPVAT